MWVFLCQLLSSLLLNAPQARKAAQAIGGAVGNESWTTYFTAVLMLGKAMAALALSRAWQGNVGGPRMHAMAHSSTALAKNVQALQTDHKPHGGLASFPWTWSSCM
jgi:hypothetical protein